MKVLVIMKVIVVMVMNDKGLGAGSMNSILTYSSLEVPTLGVTMMVMREKTLGRGNNNHNIMARTGQTLEATTLGVLINVLILEGTHQDL